MGNSGFVLSYSRFVGVLGEVVVVEMDEMKKNVDVNVIFYVFRDHEKVALCQASKKIGIEAPPHCSQRYPSDVTCNIAEQA